MSINQVLTVEERAVVVSQLAEAQAALHRVEIGGQTASVAYDGESVSYSPANVGQLRHYVRTLEAKLGLRASARARSRGVRF
ncbi:phage tail protein [Georhizobium profundi]|jgi:uncharacterized protein (DUF342 family)|uniref:Phage tail protein n=1 Tax=Georhizobium profundi TaxID=2341112 RepID=A0A3Q8XPF7_9HYPH|nr:gpW family head-tail joining protein [Georhizobium profundi]AZN72263.1 phage tail protein [Georhizobium profundi]